MVYNLRAMAESEIRILNRGQQLLLRNLLRKRDKIRDWALIELCLGTGLRTAEVCRLNNSHLRQSEVIVSTLDVDAAIAYHQPRQLPLAALVRDALTIYWGWKVERGTPLAPEAAFFCTLRTSKRLVPLDLQRIIKRASGILGFEVTPHDLRHTYAMQRYGATTDLKVVQASLGLQSLRAVQMYRQLAKAEEVSDPKHAE